MTASGWLNISLRVALAVMRILDAGVPCASCCRAAPLRVSAALLTALPAWLLQLLNKTALEHGIPDLQFIIGTNDFPFVRKSEWSKNVSSVPIVFAAIKSSSDLRVPIETTQKKQQNIHPQTNKTQSRNNKRMDAEYRRIENRKSNISSRSNRTVC